MAMAITLRPYQQEGLEKIRERFRSGDRAVLYQCATGAGKGVLMAYMARAAAENGKRAMFVVHRDYLLTQSSKLFSDLGVNHGVIAPQYTTTREPIQIASIMTLIRRMEKFPEQDLLIFDEAHRTLANSHMRVVHQWPKARIVGLTASPQRLDGKPLGDVYQSIVEGPSMRWLIDQGFLSDFEIYAPPSPGLDMSGVKTRFGEYDQIEAERRVNKPTITGSAVEHYKKLLNGKRAVVFCHGIKHSRDVVADFNSAGVRAAHIDGTMDRFERRTILASFARGETLVLSNVNLVIEGFDLPSVEGVILLRATQSIVIFLQSIGRALRPAPGKTKAIILDHVNATATHGFPDDPRDWNLDGVQRGKRDSDGPLIRVEQCERCFFVFERGPEFCPACAHVHTQKTRKIEFVDGELAQLTREQVEAAKRSRRIEQGSARTLEDLRSLAKTKGYKPGWAERVFAGRRRG